MIDLDLGTDVKIDGDYTRTATGDLQTITDLENLKEAIYRRFITIPGEVIHRPDYGIGIRRYLNRPCTDANQVEIENAVKLNIMDEPRIEAVNRIKCIWNQEYASIVISVKAFGRNVEFDYRVVRL